MNDLIKGSPFAQEMGVQVRGAGRTMALTIERRHTGSGGKVNPAVVTFLLAAACHAQAHTSSLVGPFLVWPTGSASEGETLISEARILFRIGRLLFFKSEIWVHQQRIGTGYFIRRDKPAH